MPTTPIHSDIFCENPRASWVMFGACTIGAVLGVWVCFIFMPFGQVTPPSLMVTLAHDFSAMKEHSITGVRSTKIMAYTKAPLLSDFREQHLEATVKQGSVTFSLPNGTMAAHFLEVCMTKYDCKISGGNPGGALKITVTPYPHHLITGRAS